MSRYDDPSWYEEQPNLHNQPAFSGQPAQSSFEDFDHYPFLPAPENTPQQQANGTGQTGLQAPPRGVRHVLRQVLLTLALVLIAFVGGWFAHEFFGNSFDLGNQSRSYSQLIQQAWSDIDRNYVDRKAVNYQKMSYAAINAMVSTLGDPGHTRFMDPKTAQGENQQLSGKFIGVGIYLHQDVTTKQVIVTAPIPNSPAEKAGIKSGDIIKSINGTDMTGKDTNAASGLIQGAAGTTVTLVIQRPGEAQTRTYKITRAEIAVPNVIMHYIAESHIADIQVVQFATGVSEQVRDDLNKAKSMGATKIILDLRDNPGGYLDEATNMSSLFIKSGNVLLEQDSTGQRTPYPVTGSPTNTTAPMVVLVNRYTASAAEIVTGALKENNRATVIGQTTFGTGTVLEQFNLADGSALLIGTQEWLTPGGHFIRQVVGDPNSGGIKPSLNHEVKQDVNKPTLTANQANQSNMTQPQILDSGDAQLAAAIQYLNK